MAKIYGKCNCGNKATSEWLITDHKNKTAHTIKFCDNCTPKEHYNLQNMQQIQ